MVIRAKNAHGVSANASLGIHTLPQPGPPQPTDFEISDITHNSATLSWTKSPGATSYEVRGRCLDPVSKVIVTFFDWTDIGDVASYTLTGFIPNRSCNFTLRAVNSEGTSEEVGRAFDTLPAPPSSGSSSDSRDDDDEDDSPTPTPAPTATPIRDTLNRLPAGIVVSNWVDGAQGRRVGPAGVGRADLIEQGILDAVDVWGYVTPGVEVCFAQQGRIVFLDAAYAPRRLSDLPATSHAGQTCTTIDRAGTVVLLGDEGRQLQSSQPQGAINPPLATAIPSRTTQRLNGCEVRPWADVKFRQSPPGGEVISVTSIRKWLPASEKRYGYYKVLLWGREGWISGEYVYIRGDCA